MPDIDILIQEYGATPVLQGLHGLMGVSKEQVDKATIDIMVVVEKGMTSGKTSIMFLLTHSGQKCYAETSLALLQTMVTVANGADKRFEEKRQYGTN